MSVLFGVDHDIPPSRVRPVKLVANSALPRSPSVRPQCVISGFHIASRPGARVLELNSGSAGTEKVEMGRVKQSYKPAVASHGPGSEQMIYARQHRTTPPQH